MAYNLANSLSPMMFKKKSKSDQGGTRNERMRSKSVENIVDAPSYSPQPRFHNRRTGSSTTPQPKDCEVWTEVSKVKSVHPVVACILPSLAMDFVASALLAVGATPLITEDPADIERDLESCKAVVVDVSAPSIIVEAFIEKFEVDCKPLVLIASECGTSDRKKELARQVVQKSGPNVITGKLVDIYTLHLALVEEVSSRMGSSESSEEEDKQPTSHPPKVVLSTDHGDEDPATSLPPALRRARMRRSTSPGVSPSNTPPPARKSSSPSVSPYQSPRTSPPGSTGASPRSSPVLKKRGIQKLLAKKARANSEGAALKRVPTVIPRLRMKGQFRDTKHHNIKIEDALDSAQNLAARTNAFVNIYEMSTVTSGEVIVEITNNQLGMGNIHSTMSTCGAVVGAVLACVDTCEDDDLTLKHCVHAFALYYVAAEEASSQTAAFSTEGIVSPGTLRVKLIDVLHGAEETFLRSKAEIVAHTEGTKCAFK